MNDGARVVGFKPPKARSRRGLVQVQLPNAEIHRVTGLNFERRPLRPVDDALREIIDALIAKDRNTLSSA